MQPLLPSDPTQVGRYELEGRLGTGGMGTVYLGRSPGGRLAAIKVISPYLFAQPNTLARFRREIATLRTVRSAYTAALIDYELAAPPYWMATEFIPGPTLAASLEVEGPLSLDECLLLTASLAEGLSDVHAHGICHRDLKPQNIILSATGPHLIDFGLARDTTETGLTQTDIIVGTPGYIAPELLTSDHELTPAADVFALGATIAHAATGRHPYGSGPAESICFRILQENVDLEGVDPDLEYLIRCCVARDPTLRPSPDEIIEWCRRTKGNGFAARPASPRHEPAHAPGPSGRSGSSSYPSLLSATLRHESGPGRQVADPPARPRRRLVWVLGSVAAAALLVSAGAVAARLALARGEESDSQAAPRAAVSGSVAASEQATTAPPAAQEPPPSSTYPSLAQQPPPTGKQPPVSTVTSADGRCLEMPTTDANGSQVSAAACSGSAGQQWKFTSAGALMPAAAGATRCLDIGANSGADINHRVQLWDCNSGPAQQWVPEPDGALFNTQSGRCLSILPDDADGPALAILPCTAAVTQRWRLPATSAAP